MFRNVAVKITILNRPITINSLLVWVLLMESLRAIFRVSISMSVSKVVLLFKIVRLKEALD